MNYRYVAYTEEGKIIKGSINMDSEAAVEQALLREGYRIINLKSITTSLPSLEQAFPSLFGIRSQDIIAFSRQLATLLEAGIAILPALHLLKDQVGNKAFNKAIFGIISDLQTGKSFSEALSKQPHAFNEMYCKIIGAGEKAGNLESSLKQMADYMEKQREAAKKIKGAMAYPAIVLSLAVVVILVLVTIVLPPLVGMFSSLQADLPITTRILIGITDFFEAYRLPILGGIVVAVVLGIWYVKQPSGRHLWDKAMLHLPLLGRINLLGEVSRFSRTTGMMLQSGLSLSEVIGMVKQASGNSIFREALDDVHQGLLQGKGLSEPISENKLFPPLLAHMVAVGEETGTLESSLSTVAYTYETQVDERTTALFTFMEPAMTVGIAMVIGFIALSVLMPMYQVLNSID